MPSVGVCKNPWIVCAKTYGLCVQEPMVCVCKNPWFVCAKTQGVCKNSVWFRCAKMRCGLPQRRGCANEKLCGPPSPAYIHRLTLNVRVESHSNFLLQIMIDHVEVIPNSFVFRKIRLSDPDLHSLYCIYEFMFRH